SARTDSVPAWISTSIAATGRRRRSRIFSAASPTPTTSTSRSSSAGTRRRVRRSSRSAAATMRKKPPTRSGGGAWGPRTPGQSSKQPMVIPLAFGLVGRDGRDLPLQSANAVTGGGILRIAEAEQTFVFDVSEKPVPSFNRGFAAPIKLASNLNESDFV